MRADVATQPDSRLARLVVALVGWVTRHPRAVLFVALALTLTAIQFAYAKLEYHTQRNDLLSADKPCQQRWQRHLDTFGDDDDMVVVAEGTDREQMKCALDAVAGEVKKRPDQFDRCFHKVDLRGISDRAILYLPPEQIEALRARVERMEPLFGSLGPLAWRMLTVQSLLSNGASALEKRAEGRELSPADRDLLAQLPAVASSAANTLRDPNAYRNPWELTSQANPGREAGGFSASQPTGLAVGVRQESLTEPQYFFTPDGSLAMLTCRPKKAAKSFTPAKEANETMRAILADVGPRFPGVKLGLTGLPVLETDEMALSDVDSTRASWLALIGVAGLYFVVYRGFRYPLLTVSTLVVGTVWALGWATLTVGHLNILSATFAVMLIGLGDYGVLWVARYDEARKLGHDTSEAMKLTAAHAGPSVLTAALTTSLAFFATTLADFKAVAELGWIAGCGVLFCAVACLTVLPAAMIVIERRRAERRRAGGVSPLMVPSACAKEEIIRRLTPPARQEVIPFPSAWLPGLAARPRIVLIVGAMLLLACGAFAWRLTYDHNLLNLQARGLDSVAWERKLIDRAAGATWDAMSTARSREEALKLRSKYESLPEVGKVVEVASLVPADQERKLPAVAAIHRKLAELPPKEKLPIPNGSDPAAVQRLATKVALLASSDTALSHAASDLAFAVEQCPVAAERLKHYDRRLASDLASELHKLKAVSRPAPITLADVPPELRERYVGVNGEFLVRAFAKESLWDYEALQTFTTAAQTADPEASGKSFRTLEGLRQMKRGFEWAGLYALGAIVLVLLLDFRRVSGLLLGLFPLAVGVTLTLGLMGLCGVSLNPANMIALPLIVGVGMDNAVHVLHDYRSRERSRAYRLGSATGRGVLVAGLTTVLGFGTLLTARHAGMASLGLALTLGVTCCMFAALVLLPALLHLRDRRRLKRSEVAMPAVLPFERKAA
ncbi:MAG: MMPL family transporter [Planctomycetia bacterium]|nr:MMPL family transporter [Planctomycetia bacterium]